MIKTLTELQINFKEVRKRTEDICKPLKKEDYVLQPTVDVSPPKWHLAHTTWFFEEFVLVRQGNYQRFDQEFAYLFNSYYNNVGERVLRPNRGLMSRPEVDEVYAYRAYVDQHIVQLLDSEIEKELQDLIVLGLNHEQQHQELLITDIKYILGHQSSFPVHRELAEVYEGNNSWSVIEEGIYEIGADAESFVFDNELNRHKVYLHSALIKQSLVSNEEYLEFMKNGGYEDFNFWHAEGWDWIKENSINSPMYWHFEKGEWMFYELGGYKPVNKKAAVKHISFYEASAFAAWKGCRLPTEFEWEAAHQKFNWGLRWEWTNSAYLPYPGFEKAEGAIGEYNGKFMVNQMVLRGSSVATSPGHSRPTYRNFFHPHLRWQFTGIRLAKDKK